MTITLHPTQGTYTGRPLRRVYLSEVHGVATAPSTVRKNGVVVPQRFSYGELRQNGDGFFYEVASGRLYIHTPTVPESLYQITAEGVVLAVDEARNAPQDFSLEQNYPNPFNGSTRIGFALQASGRVSLKVYDVLGREVATLLDGHINAGKHEVEFDASGSARQTAGGLASGVYVCRLRVGGYAQARKLLLIR